MVEDVFEGHTDENSGRRETTGLMARYMSEFELRTFAFPACARYPSISAVFRGRDQRSFWATLRHLALIYDI